MEQEKKIIWFLVAEPKIREFLTGYFENFNNIIVPDQKVTTFTIGGFNGQIARFLYHLAKQHSASIVIIDESMSGGPSAQGIVNEFIKLQKNVRGVIRNKTIPIIAIKTPKKRRQVSGRIIYNQVYSLC